MHPDRAPARSRTLAGQYARWLAGLFIALELVTVAAAMFLVLVPLSRRAADDLAALMVLSARTWVELPPDARPAFQSELMANHSMAVRPGMPRPTDTGLRHGLYLRFIERALEQRLGRPAFFIAETDADGQRWFWTAVRAGGERIGVGFAASRLQTYPVLAAGIAIAAGIALVMLLSWWLARRIARPVAALEKAAEQVALGGSPALLPETEASELASLARHFNRMARQVRNLLEARTLLFAGVSHDLRTPLARMRLAIEMLSLKPAPALLQRLERDVAEMDALIGQTLRLARGFTTEPAQEIELCTWLQARVKVHRATAAEAGASLRVTCGSACRVHAAPGMLARVLDNLLLNAQRHAPGPIEIVVLPSVGADGAPVMRLGVLDRGPGIPEDRRALMFRPFEHAKGDGGAKSSFGLGLSIVQQLCRANGWDVALESRTGGGLEAWVTVPASE